MPVIFISIYLLLHWCIFGCITKSTFHWLYHCFITLLFLIQLFIFPRVKNCLWIFSLAFIWLCIYFFSIMSEHLSWPSIIFPNGQAHQINSQWLISLHSWQSSWVCLFVFLFSWFWPILSIGLMQTLCCILVYWMSCFSFFVGKHTLLATKEKLCWKPFLKKFWECLKYFDLIILIDNLRKYENLG